MQPVTCFTPKCIKRREYYRKNKEKVLASNKRYYHANLEEQRAIRRENYHKNGDKLRAYARERNSKNPTYKSERHFLSKYGLTLAERDNMAKQQKNRCAICGKKSDKLHVDHDHSTGKVRALLCPQCNKAIGLMNDSIDTLQKAIVYLGFHKSTKRWLNSWGNKSRDLYTLGLSGLQHGQYFAVLCVFLMRLSSRFVPVCRTTRQ